MNSLQRRWLLLVVGAALGLVLIVVLWRAIVPPEPTPDVRELDNLTVWTRPKDGNVFTPSPVQHLPYEWDKQQRGSAGEATFHISFAAPPGNADAIMALYVPRLGNAYEIRVNGLLLSKAGSLTAYNTSDHGKKPLLLQLPPKLVRENHNDIDIHVRADTGRRGGMSRAFIGPYASLKPLYDFDYRWRIQGSAVAVAMSLFFAAVGLTLWASHTRIPSVSDVGTDDSTPIYGYLVLAELAWAIKVVDPLLDNPPMTWIPWSILQVFTVAVWAVALTNFFAVVGDWRHMRAWRYLRVWLAVLVASSVLATAVAIGMGLPHVLTAWYVAITASFLVFALVNIPTLFRGTPLQRLLVLALLVNVLVAIRDWYMFRVAPGMATNTFVRYSALLFGFTLAIAAVSRFRAVQRHAQILAQTLHQRVTARERELAQSYERLERMAREQARTQERSRILKDMHDGVGVHLSTAIRLLRTGDGNRTELLRTLTDSLDQLKLSIDAMQFEPGDINAMLAALRYRLEPRLQASGLSLRWQVDELPPVPRLDDINTRHLQFLLFEAISNVLQHAHAHWLTISASRKGDTLHLSVEDDGVGFDTTQTRHRGLHGMAERAVKIGASLVIDSGPQGTRVQLTFPLAPEAT